jgi:hypothetical protein
MDTVLPFTESSQFQALARVAAFSAALRGHQLAGWLESVDSATAVCAECQSGVTVYRSLLEPTVDGLALEVDCPAHVRHIAA